MPTGLIVQGVVAVDKDKNIDNNKRRKQSSKNMNSQTDTIKAPFVSNSSAECEDVMRQSNEIPTFDLAEQIMAEHRKMTAVKRKGPGRMARPPQKRHPAESIERNVVPGPVLSGPEQVIAEIVARDIKNLCIRNAS